ncbi:hypothetical protein MF271_19235 (plasmid) [Deinococcus sp. KNUC1210]|uniref:hypothetical protein n=1 Tax=Deinococcus sp. KNUC1210 TaxID=2917691 RepID=UPI001EF0618F|nr:hypothetical protein [Deinococcus sp. KNUC1210]ULH17325.1 hypothetical protein MF271_19235 [Deinococcus sp. KNUC1210]
MRGRLLSILALASLLAACMPSVYTSPATVPEEATFIRSSGENYDTLTFDPGKFPVFSAVAYLSGDVLRLNDKRCAVVQTHVECQLGDVPAGKSKVLYASGVKVARVEYGLGDSKTHVVALK